jgi:hypothetical protein
MKDPDDFNQAVADQLIGYFKSSAGKLGALLIEPKGKSPDSQKWNASRAAMRINQVHEEIKTLKANITDWAGPTFKDAYKKGLKVGRQQASDLGIRHEGMSGSLSNRFDAGAVRKLAQDAAADLVKASKSMEDHAVKTLRRMAATGVTNAEVNKILAGGVIQGSTVQASRDLREALRKVHGETVTVTGKSGTPMTFEVDYYANMVARSKIRQAVQESRHEALRSVGVTLVRVVGRQSKNFCTAFLGRVFSIDGKTDKYPSIDELPGGGDGMHPNCSKSSAPYDKDLATKDQVTRSIMTDDEKKLLGVSAYEAQKTYKGLQIRQER